MNRMLSAVGALALLAAGPSDATAAESHVFAGEYQMQGRGFASQDSPYGGSCTLRGDGPAYDVTCFNVDTRHTYVGRGLASGDTLAIFIGDLLNGDHRALFAGEYLVLYRRQTDGTLDGTWIDVQGLAAGRETLTPVVR